MATIKHNGITFTISEEIQQNHSELVELVLHTESMDSAEKQYWFDILPSMTNEQVQKLYDILDTERKKLQELEEKYQKEIESLNEKHLSEWQNYQQKKQSQKMKKQEANDRESETEGAESLINEAASWV